MDQQRQEQQHKFEPNYVAVTRVALARLTGLTILCVVLLLANAGTMYWVWQLQRNLRIPVHVSGGTAYVSPEALVGISIHDAKLLPEVDGVGRMLLEMSFAMLSRSPGSQLAVLYRAAQADPWLRVAASEVGPLEFRAAVPVAPGAETITYRVAELMRDEVIRVTRPQDYPVGHYTAGRVHLEHVANWQGTSISRFYLSAGAHIVTPVSVSEIVVRVVRPSSSDETHTLNSDTGDWFNSSPTGIDRLEITVRYRDGEVRAATVRPPWDQVSNPIVER